ncbi:MAG: CAP domain-containing protein [Gemmatimonadaceae bacterium]
MPAVRVCAYIVSFPLVIGCAMPINGAPEPPPVARVSSPYGATEARIFDLINAQRRERALAPLVYNEQLDRAAKIQAENMAKFQKMAHVLPGSNLPTLGDRARFVGYPYNLLAENIAVGYPDAGAVVQGWMASTGHRQNILDRAVVETGIGVFRSEGGALYFCQVFGRRLSSL